LKAQVSHRWKHAEVLPAKFLRMDKPQPECRQRLNAYAKVVTCAFVTKANKMTRKAKEDSSNESASTIGVIIREQYKRNAISHRTKAI